MEDLSLSLSVQLYESANAEGWVVGGEPTPPLLTHGVLSPDTYLVGGYLSIPPWSPALPGGNTLFFRFP